MTYPHNKYWTDDKLNWIRENCNGISRIELCDLYNKQFNDEVKIAKFNGMLNRYHIRNNIDCTFKKGKISPNKGKRQEEYMSQEAIQRTIATRFKKESGHKQGEIYDKIKHSKNKKFIKLSNKCGDEMLYARYVYEQKIGRKLLSDEKIIHLDGNYSNCNINNLILVNNSDHLRIISKCGGYHKNKDINKAIILKQKLESKLSK